MKAPTIHTPAAPLEASYQPATKIAELSATAPISEILEILDRDGGLILTDLVSTADLSSIATETKPHYDNKPKHTVAIIPQQTVLLGGLVGKSPTAAKICEHHVLKALRDTILVDRFDIRNEEVTSKALTVEPLLSVSLTFNIGPGAPRQRLHRDDQIWGTKHARPFVLHQQEQLACLVAASDVRRENGATMFVPGSHRWDDEREPRLDEICFAEMKPGSALIFLASAYHGGGHNALPDFIRTVHGFFFCRGTLRTEENQFLAIPRSVAMGMSEEMLSLLGYKKPGTTLGVVESVDPMSDLQGCLLKANA
ncbi:hypothetical protein BP5796_05566 [Coleophoma crateriformis]|uniref:Phytanoyl-CoA dioxygenase n=1 Tax=Coleophoma crateriformis TaxID=565419 RepID=A0A3D8S3M6_9HELO|nr:hypothetical protein BP5796_05566 [Coleophoma crateriformis]